MSDSRLYFVYARYRTKERAYDALEQMYAVDEVRPSEVHSIVCVRGIWEVRLYVD
jgi:hypothetical protein